MIRFCFHFLLIIQVLVITSLKTNIYHYNLRNTLLKSNKNKILDTLVNTSIEEIIVTIEATDKDSLIEFTNDNNLLKTKIPVFDNMASVLRKVCSKIN